MQRREVRIDPQRLLKVPPCRTGLLQLPLDHAPVVRVQRAAYPAADARVSRLEVFGPVVAVYRYADLDNAIARANALPTAFQASIFAQDIDIAMRAANRLDASAVMINDPTAFRTDWMPFAGRRESGYGTGGIPYTMRDMTQEKMILMRRS